MYKHVNKDDVIVGRKKIEEVDRYVFLGQMVTKDHDQVQEMKKRIDVERILQAGQCPQSSINLLYSTYSQINIPLFLKSPLKVMSMHSSLVIS